MAERPKFLLPDGEVEINVKADAFYKASKGIVSIVESRKRSLESFYDFTESNLRFPSAHFRNKDFEYLEGDAEDDLIKLFSQIPDAAGVFLKRHVMFDFWLEGNDALARLLVGSFPVGLYVQAWKDKVLMPLVSYVKGQQASLNFKATIASRQVHDLKNREAGIVKTIWNVGKEGRIVANFCTYCDGKFRNCIRHAVTLMENDFSREVVHLLELSLVKSIGVVRDGLDICEYQEKVRRKFAERTSLDEVRAAMSILPFEPMVIRRAFEIYGDRGGVISSVAKVYGVDANHEKIKLLEEIADSATNSCEKDVLTKLGDFRRLMVALEVEENECVLALLRKIENRLARLDKLFRTVEGVAFPTRLEAAMTRNDVKFLSEVLDEDVSRCVRLLARSNSFLDAVKDCISFGRGGDVVGKIGVVLEKIGTRKVHSPFLRLVERALKHVKDFSLYAGNMRFDDESAANEARRAKETLLLECIRTTHHPRESLRLDRAVYLKLKFQGIGAMFRKHERTPLEEFVISHFLGDAFPKSVRSLRDVLKWQLGCDFFDRTEEAYVEISDSGIPSGCVSLTLNGSGDACPIFSDDDVVTTVPEFSLRTYGPACGQGETGNPEAHADSRQEKHGRDNEV